MTSASSLVTSPQGADAVLLRFVGAGAGAGASASASSLAAFGALALRFFDDDGATVHAVDYKPNRAVFFPADLVHAAEAPSAEFPGLRVSLAYKLKLRE